MSPENPYGLDGHTVWAMLALEAIRARDSGSRSSEPRRAAARGAGRQSGDGTAGASPNPSDPQSPKEEV